MICQEIMGMVQGVTGKNTGGPGFIRGLVLKGKTNGKDYYIEAGNVRLKVFNGKLQIGERKRSGFMESKGEWKDRIAEGMVRVPGCGP